MFLLLEEALLWNLEAQTSGICLPQLPATFPFANSILAAPYICVMPVNARQTATLSFMTTYSLRKLRLRPGEEHRDEVAVQLEPFELGGQRYLPVPGEAPAELTINRATGGDVFRLRFQTRLHGPCMRCLEDAVVPVSVDAREYHSGDDRADEQLQTAYVVDDRLELSQWGRDAIALELPEQILCRPDCAGLCFVCGANLNLEPHEHAEVAPDPRWAALETLRDRL